MNNAFRHWVAAALLAALSAYAAAASLDLGRIFDVGRDLRTAAVGLDEKDEIALTQIVSALISTRHVRLMRPACSCSRSNADRNQHGDARWLAKLRSRRTLMLRY